MLVAAVGNVKTVLVALFLFVCLVRVKSLGFLFVLAVTFLIFLTVDGVECYSIFFFEGRLLSARFRSIRLTRAYLVFV